MLTGTLVKEGIAVRLTQSLISYFQCGEAGV